VTLPRRLRQAPWIIVFVLFFLWELVLANARVAWEVLTPGFSMRPGIVRVPLRTRTDWQTTVLANAISMTPGTLSLEVSADGKDLYVHSLYVDTREAFQADVARMERLLLRAFGC
jgi:multicomponent Na+:H+ antiporter subunit E